MFAKSEKIENVGKGNIPLFAKQVPLPATHYGTAGVDIKQYQVVAFDASANLVTPVTYIGGVSIPAPLLAVAAFPAKSGERVAFYTHGTFNVNAVDVSAIASLVSANTNTKMTSLNSIGSQTVFFDVVFTDPVQRT